ncbi:MAG: phosphoribosylamine--glycine ligase [Flavobacteriales bacterium]|nr:phosphoribosylamine--glycine ligase [Flavobacteriales bacterium]
MNILLLGSGGREHALAWKMAQSSKLSKLYIAPGNAGTAECGENIALDISDFGAIKQEVLSRSIDIVVVGPEAPLVEGIADYFAGDNELNSVAVIGPKKLGAMLEGSKQFAKEFMFRHNVPTAKYESFNKSNLQDGYAFLEKLKPPYVLKADGLAAGKGVLILDNLEEAKRELYLMIEDNKFGEASANVVIEEFLKGIELSVFVLTDGESYKILPEAKDYKRIGEGDTGLNTGGMGAISPVPFADDDFMKKVEEQVVKPTIEGFKKDGFDYKGFVFIGLMNDNGNPSVVEYNVRMGDPETEVVIPRIKSDLVELFEATGNGTLDNYRLEIDERTATTVMLVSDGYPESYEKGKIMTGLDAVTESIAFHAGTKEQDNDVITSGGRVLALTSFGSTMKEALDKSFKSAGLVDFEGKYFRSDIGFDLVNEPSAV